MTDILLTDSDPVVCAETLCDQHLLLQITQTASILSGVARKIGVVGEYYGTAPKDSKIVEWAMRDEHHQVWLAAYSTCLIEEYISRFGPEDAPKEFGQMVACCNLIEMVFECGKEDLEFQMPQVWWECETPKNIFKKYRTKLSNELNQISCKWTKSYPPHWLKESGISLKRVGDLIFKQ